jgi:hypothetical protein
MVEVAPHPFPLKEDLVLRLEAKDSMQFIRVQHLSV